MPLHLDNFKNRPPIAILKDSDINGLSFFKKELEKLFFSEVIIRNSATDMRSAKLVIELNCNYNLIEGLIHLDEGIWGQWKKSRSHIFSDSLFYKLMSGLKSKNEFHIDVEELSFVFTDSTVIVNKIYEGSIPKQLDAILTKLSSHFIYLTNRNREIPFEIFIPIFEEGEQSFVADNRIPAKAAKGKMQRKDYFNYWGLYFYSQEDDGLIYTLRNKSISSGELNMLNE
ncbi:hypothetical protein [Maribacter sp. 2-571]|uniref:hypothetical protein n=1 Tax=Maribacter sp. 2-571 TaxID=3417569 RepID=UPI003D32B502